MEDLSSVRLNKYLSDAGICSRREADRLIEAGRVCVNGTEAVMGQKISPEDAVTVDQAPVRKKECLVLLAFHKPTGIECTTARNVPDNIIDYINYPTRIFPIGRLDKNSSGLILLTNEGELSDRILRGSNYHEKEYVVTLDRPVTEEFLQNMREGVEIELEDGARKAVTRPCKVEAEGRCCIRIILTQGLNRQIRRMCQALGWQVVTLQRVRIMNILLGSLPVGHYRNVTEPELRELRRQLSENTFQGCRDC